MNEIASNLSIIDRGFDSINTNINKATARARILLIDLMQLAYIDGKVPEVPFTFTRRGPDCVHIDVKKERALVLGSETDERRRGHEVILKADGSIVSISFSDTKGIYSTETRREWERSFGGHHSREVIRTRRSLKEIQYSGEKQEELEGVDYLKWSLVARDRIAALLRGDTGENV